MTKHTPGPWTADGLHHVWRRYEDELGRRVHRPVADVVVIGVQHDEAEANARLIESAPVMLELLREAIDAGMPYGPSWFGQIGWTARVAEAIAKAEGR